MKKMIVPIFPLPNVVLFPKTLLPLHIFEPRYRSMTREAIAGDGKIVIVLLKEGWEMEYKGNPPVHEIACLGQIETYEEVDGRKYNIVLAGVHRVRLVREIEHSPYRRAEVELIPEHSCDEQTEDVIIRQSHLAGLFMRFTELATSEKYPAAEMVLQLSFEAVVNMVASTLNLPAADKQTLLEMDDLCSRCDMLIPILNRQLETLVMVRAFEHIKPDDPRWN